MTAAFAHQLARIRLALIALLTVCSAVAALSADSDFKPLFNGKDLTGWDGNATFWSARDGAITGQSTPEKKVQPNTFLVWKGGEPANFELRGSFRLTGQNKKKFGNSGVQYRSKVIDEAQFIVGGYQMDIDLTGRYTGMLYEERGRGILMNPGEKIKVGETTVDPTTKRKKTTVEKLPAQHPPTKSARPTRLANGTNFASSPMARTWSNLSTASSRPT